MWKLNFFSQGFVIIDIFAVAAVYSDLVELFVKSIFFFIMYVYTIICSVNSGHIIIREGSFKCLKLLVPSVFTIRCMPSTLNQAVDNSGLPFTS